jgi:hypothetical protein
MSKISTVLFWSNSAPILDDSGSSKQPTFTDCRPSQLGSLSRERPTERSSPQPGRAAPRCEIKFGLKRLRLDQSGLVFDPPEMLSQWRPPSPPTKTRPQVMRSPANLARKRSLWSG